MADYPPMIRRRVSRLRWTAALLCLFWLTLAIGFYRLYQYIPHTPPVMALATGIAILLGAGAVWFVYLVYRIGEVAAVGEDGEAGPPEET